MLEKIRSPDTLYLHLFPAFHLFFVYVVHFVNVDALHADDFLSIELFV